MNNQRLFRRGFTLIELSIVILILGILVTVMFTTLGSLLQIISSASLMQMRKSRPFLPFRYFVQESIRPITSVIKSASGSLGEKTVMEIFDKIA